MIRLNAKSFDPSVFDGIRAIIADTEQEIKKKRSLSVLQETMNTFRECVGADVVDKLKWVICYTDSIPTQLYVTWEYLDERVLKLVLTDSRECSIDVTLPDSEPFSLKCVINTDERPQGLVLIADLLRRITCGS